MHLQPWDFLSLGTGLRCISLEGTGARVRRLRLSLPQPWQCVLGTGFPAKMTQDLKRARVVSCEGPFKSPSMPPDLVVHLLKTSHLPDQSQPL